ncbi:unnamed protein product [Rangifer tarandus platyrhynchus]|uniref:Uncharacterized protein n=1 Tax=Rangifer tarandus platyrhynchus TaxID=3082113 RepID=A0ABN8ZZD4_RANTA|nr:unnamed protein product [Rangifer tarandus platyrhynchus]
MQKTQVQSLGREDLLEKEMATHSSILAWKIPWTEKPCRLQSLGSQRVGRTKRLHFHFQTPLSQKKYKMHCKGIDLGRGRCCGYSCSPPWQPLSYLSGAEHLVNLMKPTYLPSRETYTYGQFAYRTRHSLDLPMAHQLIPWGSSSMKNRLAAYQKHDEFYIH